MNTVDDFLQSFSGRGCIACLRGSNQQHNLKARGRWRTTGVVCKVFVPNVSGEGRFIWRCSIHGAVCVSLSSLCINMNKLNTKWHIGPCSAHLQPMSRALCLLLSRASDDQGCHCGPGAEGDKMSTCDMSLRAAQHFPPALFCFNLSSMGFSVIYAHV